MPVIMDMQQVMSVYKTYIAMMIQHVKTITGYTI